MGTRASSERDINPTLEKRAIVADGRATTVALEPPYWRFFEVFAAEQKRDWRSMVQGFIERMPDQFQSRAAYLRLVAFKILLGVSNRELHDRTFSGFRMGRAS